MVHFYLLRKDFSPFINITPTLLLFTNGKIVAQSDLTDFPTHTACERHLEFSFDGIKAHFSFPQKPFTNS